MEFFSFRGGQPHLWLAAGRGIRYQHALVKNRSSYPVKRIRIRTDIKIEAALLHCFWFVCLYLPH